ncbi:hypothetical protein LTS03_006560 [Exophiala xenobiotica]|nr:hypothetical protein LTR92_007663 [Exophiala xenobiotica]KAK5249413.1 hypothetical protein LTS06_005639 [Exophiala xenobiotica]KAK5349218.1 hypothetical protein LTR61_007256 [Exophiala xenobiotica]KAK5372872.1 hypothetical protein LTS03_006560 [Exophiala xenobiotica]
MSDPSMPAPVYGPRPYPISENDHRGIVMTIGVLYIIYAFMILGMRLASKYNHMGMDDWLSIAATGIAVPQFGAVIAATTNGSFGSSYSLLSLSDTDTVARALSWQSQSDAIPRERFMQRAQGVAQVLYVVLPQLFVRFN